MQDQRLEISRELHDSLGAQLTFISTISDGLRHSTNITDEKVKKKLRTLSDFSENAIVELKNTLWVLNSSSISLVDLQAKILNIIKHASEAKDELQFDFSFDIVNNYTLSSKQAVNLFRVVQEIINNAIKYAETSYIKIEVRQQEHQLTVHIADRGKGFNYEKEKNKSFGLRNIESRIAAIHGKLHHETAPGEGTGYTIQIELQP